MRTNEQQHRSNDITSGIIHLFGVGLAIAVMVVLLVVGARYGTAWHVVSYSLYGTGLIALYIASSTYHLIQHRHTHLKQFFRRFDHAMIYVLIASTYTPITFIALDGGWRWSIFGVIWGLALIGTTLKMSGIIMNSWVSTLLYLGMGWLIVIAFLPLREQLSSGMLWILLTGGISYTVGVGFFALDKILHKRKYFWMHEVFHLCVLGGSALHTILMFYLV